MKWTVTHLNGCSRKTLSWGLADLTTDGTECTDRHPCDEVCCLFLPWASPIHSFTGALATKGGTFVTGTVYRGAAAPGAADWWAGWTNYSDN